MRRVYITYLGNSMELPEGDTVVGRSLSCRMQFDDSAVSREHAAIRVESDSVTVEDLSSQNGTFINGERLTSISTVGDGDELAIGSRRLRITVADDSGAFEDVPTETHALETVRPERRRHARHRIEVPINYTSTNLTVESMALDLSRSGAFVRTPILDEVGTACKLTLMVDGSPALAFSGRVTRVVETESRTQPLGLGIEFCDLTGNARRWLDDTLARVGTH